MVWHIICTHLGKISYFAKVEQLLGEYSSSRKREFDSTICREIPWKQRVWVFLCVDPLTDFGLHSSSGWLLLSRRVWRWVARRLWDKILGAELQQSGVQGWCTKRLRPGPSLAIRYQHTPLCEEQTQELTNAAFSYGAPFCLWFM